MGQEPNTTIGYFSKTTLGIENNCNFCTSQMSKSRASPSTEGNSLDRFQETMNTQEGFPSCCLELWDAVANIKTNKMLIIFKSMHLYHVV